MASTTGDGAFEANFPDNKLTLYLAQDGGRVLRVTFHDTFSWCHETSWICTLKPDKYSPHINHHKFRQRLSALKEQFATHGRLTSIQFDRWIFVFGHETEDIADDMLGRYTSLKEIILKFIQEFDARVTDITMKSESMKVDAAAARKDQETVPGGTTDHDVPCKDKHDVHEDTSHSHPHKKKGNVTYTGMTGNSKAEDSLVAGQVNTGNTNINISLYLRESSGKADYQTNWETTNDIPQRPFIDFESLATRLKQMFNAILLRVRMGSMVFCFEHESKGDAINMIIRHAEVKEVILHFLQELDPSIQDIRMKVEFRELYQPEEQTADTSETRPRGMTDPEHKGEEGTSRSHPQQKDETSHLHIQETGDDSSSLSHSPQKKKKYEDTCLPHPQETEEDKTSLQQTDKDTSHLHPQKTEEDKTSLQQTDEYTSHQHPQKTEEDKTSLQQTDEYTSHLHPQKTEEDKTSLQQTDEYTSHQHPQKTEEDKTSLQQTDEDTCLPHPQKTEEDKTSLQQTDEDTSHLQPQEVYVKDKSKYQPIKIEKVSGSHSSEYTSSDPSRRRMYPWLSTASHATPTQADRDLFYASKVGDLEEVKRLLTTPGIDVDCRVGWENLTPVMAAARYGHREMVELLKSEGVNVSLVDEDRNNILHYACMGGDVETVKYVLSLNVADINSRGWSSKTPVMEAAYKGPREVVELLVSKGADASLVNKLGNNILHYACMGGDVETVKYVLSLNVADINSRGWRSKTPVMEAAYKGHREVVELLVSKGADVSKVDEDGENILHYACMGGDVETVKYVLSLNVADINSRGWSSKTPVMEAAYKGPREVVELLVSKGADASLVNKVGNNILHYACMGGDVETVKYVLSLNVADINSRGWSSKTPVMKAAYKGPREVVELLVSKGADVSLVDEDGENILHLACMGGDVETVKYVLSLNVADIDARNRRGLTAADVARRGERQQVVELLKSRGAH